MSVETVKVVANGKESLIQLPCSVGEYIRQCGWRTTQVVVEHNGKVLNRSDIDNVALANNDRLEVIVPVAGG